MNKLLPIKFDSTDRRAAVVLILFALAFIVLTLTQDALRSHVNHSPFYFPESFIFSSFWWLFAPILFMQYFAVKYKNRQRIVFKALMILLPIFLHLVAFPSLVFVLSSAFYYHTYSFQQTLRYTLSEHVYLLLVIYSIPVLTFQALQKKTKLAAPNDETQDDNNNNQFLTTIVVSDGNKRHPLPVSEILYFSANPPYINVHLEDKKYLHNETLKSILTSLNPGEFVRVHKSTIVNIKMVASYVTRLNGDYDLIMKNNVLIRVSRNFAADFKSLFNKAHHVAAK